MAYDNPISIRGVCLIALFAVVTSALAPNQSRAASPRIGIDTRFGDTVREANSAMKAKRYDEAIAKLTAALAMNPDPKNAAMLHAARAGAFLSKNDRAHAESDAIAAVGLDPASADAHLKRGLVHRSKEQKEEAIAEYTRAIQIQPDWPGLYNNRGVAYVHTQQLERAMRDFNEALRRAPNLAEAIINRGNTYEQLGQSNKALADYEEAIRMHPNIEYAHYNRAKLLKKLGNYGRAVADYNEAVRRSPRDPRMYDARGDVYRLQKMTDRAVADYRRASGLPASDAIAHCARGSAFYRLGQYGQAAAEYRVAKAQLPRSGHVIGHSAWLKATCPDAAFRNGAEALDEAKQACELTNWKNGDHVDTLAAAYAETGDFENALKYQTQAIKLQGPSADKEMEAHLRGYQERRPWRQEPVR